jgi:CRISPR-associated protein Cmr1
MVAYGSIPKKTHSGQLERSCITEGQEFTVRLMFRDRIEESVKEALVAFGLLGGLGSRSRHGMGSIALSSLCVNGKEEWTLPVTANDYDAKIRELFTATMLPTDFPPFSAFWRDARIDRLLSAHDCYKILDDFGKAMLMYRSWGNTNKKKNVLPGGEVSEKRFVDDHHWCRANKDERKKDYVNFHPARVVFGLPHNYGKPERQWVNGANHERRSSPLLFHVHRVGDIFVGVSIYLPAQFLPQGEEINAGGSHVSTDIMWSIIPCFLDGKVGNKPLADAKDRFPSPSKKAVLP